MSVALIARREVTTRLQQKGFRIGFAISLLVLVVVCVLPAFFGGDGGRTTYDLGVTTQTRSVSGSLTAVGKAAGVGVRLHTVDAAQADRQVRSGALDAALLPGERVVAKDANGAAVTLVRTAYQLSTTVARLEAQGLSADQVRRALDVPPLRVTTTSSSKSTERQTIAVVAVVVLFSQLITFCTWVAMGVVEEKSSRVVELVLSAVRPMQLLTGKLVGIGLLAAAQVLILGVVALVAGSVAGTLTLPASAIATVAVSFGGFVLGYAFFASLAAGLASTVSRQEEVSGVLTPVTLALTVCYFASFATTRNPDGTLAKVLSVVPPVSAVAMPGRIAHGGVPWWQIALAVALLALAAAAVASVAARIYRASVLRSGTRVPLRVAWRGSS